MRKIESRLKKEKIGKKISLLTQLSSEKSSEKIFLPKKRSSATLLGPRRLKWDILYLRHQVRLLSEWDVHDNQTSSADF